MFRPSPSGGPVPPIIDVQRRTPNRLAGSERRDLARREAIVRRIVAEFQDMPGLVLSLKQASRFLGVDEAACGRILASLTAAGVLRLSASEYYSKCESGI